VAAIVIFAIIGKATAWILARAAAPFLRWQGNISRQGGAA